jgi:hypothetical protein
MKEVRSMSPVTHDWVFVGLVAIFLFGIFAAFYTQEVIWASLSVSGGVGYLIIRGQTKFRTRHLLIAAAIGLAAACVLDAFVYYNTASAEDLGKLNISLAKVLVYSITALFGVAVGLSYNLEKKTP